jgi:hypothetical protein
MSLPDRDDGRSLTAITDPEPVLAAEAAAPADLARQMEGRLGQVRAQREAEARRVLADGISSLACTSLPLIGRSQLGTTWRLVDLEATTWRRMATATITLPAAETEGLDPTTLRLGLAAAAMAPRRDPTSWLLPVGFEAFEPRSRANRTMEALRELLPVAPDRLVPVLNDVPAAAGNRRVGDLLLLLRSLGGAAGIAAETPEALPCDPQEKTAGFILLDALPLLEALRRRPKAAAAGIARLTATGARIVCSGARDAEQMTELLRAGCEFVVPASGSALAAATLTTA